MTKFIFNWNGTGKNREVVEGNSISEAFSMAGYGAGAIRALDYYETVPQDHEGKTDEEILNEIQRL